jgi:ABC-2 type transport system permease protein
MTAFAQHFAFEFKVGLRNPALLFLNYVFPLAFYALMGTVMTKINPGFTGTLLPAMVIFACMTGTLLGLPNPLVDSREAGIYRSFKINGVPAASILAIPAITTALHALIVSAIIALTAPSLFKGEPPADWAAFAAITVLAAFTCSALGALIGVVSANTQATVLWAQAIFLPSMLVGGLMMPLNLLPVSIRSFAALLPTTQAMQALLGLAYGQETVFAPLTSAGILLATGLLAFGLAIYLFNWDSRNSSRRGHPALALLVLVPALVGLLFR